VQHLKILIRLNILRIFGRSLTSRDEKLSLSLRKFYIMCICDEVHLDLALPACAFCAVTHICVKQFAVMLRCFSWGALKILHVSEVFIFCSLVARLSFMYIVTIIESFDI
jgi:hypothetical protein